MSQPLKILQVADLFEPFIGGMEQHVKTLSQELTQRGHEVTIATAHIPGTLVAESIDGYKVRRIRGWSGRALAGWYERDEAPFHPPLPDPGVVAVLGQIIDEISPDIVHAQGWISYSCLAVARRRQFRLVVTMHDHSLACIRKTLMRKNLQMCTGPRFDACLRCAPGQYGLVKGTALTTGLRAARPLHARADSWVAVSQSVADSTRCVLPRGSVISVIPSASAQPPLLGKRPSWLPADGYLLFVGALGRHKGLNVLLEAYARGKFKRPLVVIGTSRGDTPKSWPAGVLVRTDVPHPEVMEAWRHAGIALVPSLCREGFGLVAVEAMRSGVPVIASRIGALPEIVADGITGVLVEPGNTSQLQVAIRRLDEDPALCRRMGAAGMVKARKFSAETVAGLYEEHYGQLLDVQRQVSSDTAVMAREGVL